MTSPSAPRRPVDGIAAPALPSPGAGLSRRRALGFLGAGTGALLGATLLPATAAEATCTATDEQEIGPFYVNEGLVRSDIRSGQSGVPLALTFTIDNSDTCSPLVGAAVDIWQANASGVYSDESSENTVGQTYLRGIQITDSSGKAGFTTIIPGWYSGRTMHIHARIRTGGTLTGSSYTGGNVLWTGQVFFDAAVDTAVASTATYSSNRTTRTVNSSDRVYTQQNGDENVVTTSGSPTSGYTGTVTLSVPAGTSTTPVSSVTISGASTRSTTYGATVALTGAAPAGSSVGVWFHEAGTSGYVQRRTLTASSSGAWSTSYVANDDYRIYATSGSSSSAPILVQIAPTITGASSVTVGKGSTYTIRGTGIPGSTLTVHFHRAGTASTDYSILRTVTVGSAGSWSRSFVASVDYRFFASLPNGLTSRTVLVQAR